MLTLLITGIVGIIVIFTLVIIIRNRPDFWFWLFLNLYFDPGGFVGGYRDGILIGPLGIADVCIAGIVICLLYAKINWEVVYQDQFFSKFLLALFIFTLYYFIAYGGIVPYFHNDFNYPTFLMKNRQFIYGLIILIAVYFFSMRGLDYFYSITLFIGAICLTLFFITLITGVELIPIWELRREGTEMTRISMYSYGLFNLVFPIALTVYLLSRKVNINLKYKSLLYYAGIVMILTLLITLTRRTQIDIIGTTLIIVLIISYLLRTSKIAGIFKLVVPAVLVIVVLYFTLPDYGDYITKTAEDTFLILTTGENISGQREDRVTGTGDLDVAKEYINDNILFGTGWTYLHWGGTRIATSPRGVVYSRAADAAGEVPIYYLFFGFGLVGAILMLPLYFMLGKLFFNLIKVLKLTLINYLQDPMTIIFSIYILLTIAVKFTINLYQLSSDFMGPYISYTAVFIGLGFALYRKIYLNFILKDVNN